MIIDVNTIKLNFAGKDLFLNLGSEEIVSTKKEIKKTKIKLSDEKIIHEPYFVIFVTNRCNFKCSYCFNNKCHTTLDMTFKPEVFLSFLKKNGYKKIQIRFFGGEPLLNKQWIYECVEILAKNNIECKYNIFTNSTLIDKKFMEFSKKHNFQFFVSVAGKNEFEKGVKHKKIICEKIDIINENKLNLMTRSLYNPAQTTLLELVNDIFEHNIRFLSICFEWGEKVKNPEEIIDKVKIDLKEFADFYIDNILRRNFKYIGIHPFAGYIKNWILNEEYHLNACGAGKNLFSLSTNGEIFSCHALNQEGDFKCGDISGKIESNLANVNLESIDACRKCDIKYLCKTRCFADSYLTNGNHLEVVNLKCRLEREIVACSAYIYYTLTKFKKEFKLFKYLIEKGVENYDTTH